MSRGFGLAASLFMLYLWRAHDFDQRKMIWDYSQECLNAKSYRQDERHLACDWSRWASRPITRLRSRSVASSTFIQDLSRRDALWLYHRTCHVPRVLLEYWWKSRAFDISPLAYRSARSVLDKPYVLVQCWLDVGLDSDPAFVSACIKHCKHFAGSCRAFLRRHFPLPNRPMLLNR